MKSTVTVLLFVALAIPALTQDAGDPSTIPPAEKEYSPYLEHEYPDQVYFGDTHVHTRNSLDARGFGERSGPRRLLSWLEGQRWYPTMANR